ncbi:small membrane protein [Raoultella terrigena]
MGNFLFLALAVTLLVISVFSLCSYLKDIRKHKHAFKNKCR